MLIVNRPLMVQRDLLPQYIDLLELLVHLREVLLHFFAPLVKRADLVANLLLKLLVLGLFTLDLILVELLLAAVVAA